MKRAIFLLGSTIFLSGCGSQGHIAAPQSAVAEAIQQSIEAEESGGEALPDAKAAEEAAMNSAVEDVTDENVTDLTQMNGDMVYGVVFEMMTEPEKYLGKEIKMKGTCNRFTDPDTGKDYYACIITDAAACCAQGIEFELPEGEEYPEYGSDITIQGTFSSYLEKGNEFYVLKDAKLS